MLVKQLVILSGKGGTGKTSISAAFAHLSFQSTQQIQTVLVDADVDAANLRFILQPEVEETNAFYGAALAKIDPDLCSGCGACVPVCRYDAILPDSVNPAVYWIDPIACDGCAACVYACPQNAIQMEIQQEGHWYRSKTQFGHLFHAELFPGRENSGKLVTLVKQHARLFAEDTSLPLVIVDGPPGIGCPVISACAGADLGLIVTEPSLSGIHDLKRIQATLEHFKVPQVICINKADIYPDGAENIRQFAHENGISVAGEVPFDDNLHQAMLIGLPVTIAYPEAGSAVAINKIWNLLEEQLKSE
jgi:MinD superfamily P-loop ATPase